MVIETCWTWTWGEFGSLRASSLYSRNLSDAYNPISGFMYDDGHTAYLQNLT